MAEIDNLDVTEKLKTSAKRCRYQYYVKGCSLVIRIFKL